MLNMTEEIVITKHAYMRMKERNGWNKKAATRIVSRVYNDGIRPEQVKGYLKEWVNTKYEYRNDGDEYVLFGDKLFSILYEDEGIFATAFCNSKSMYRNDKDRFDGKTEYISTSIEYPNVWYYCNKKNVNPYVNNWAVIFIDPALSQDDKTLFCPINSAASKGAYISGDVENLRASFNQQVGYRRRTSNMLYCGPTDDQAEVLLYKHVPVSRITGIAFESEHTLNTMLKLFEKYKIIYPDLYLSKELFSSRMSDSIRNGCRPREIVR